MTKRSLQIAASALILVALALIVLGLTHEQSVVWGLGLLVLGAAMGMSLATVGSVKVRNSCARVTAGIDQAAGDGGSYVAGCPTCISS